MSVDVNVALLILAVFTLVHASILALYVIPWVNILRRESLEDIRHLDRLETRLREIEDEQP